MEHLKSAQRGLKIWLLSGTALFLFFALCLSLGGLMLYKVEPVWRGDVIAAFAHELSDYVRLHQGRLPEDWRKFVVWNDSFYGRKRWNSKDLERSFALSRDNAEDKKYATYVQVLDPKAKNMEGFINWCVATEIRK